MVCPLRIEQKPRGINAPYAFLFSFAVSVQTFAVDPLFFSRGFSLYAPACSVPAVTSAPVAILFQCLFLASVFWLHAVYVSDFFLSPLQQYQQLD